MFIRVERAESEVMELPGRTWHSYLGPRNAPTRLSSMGISIFPPGSRPAGHVHAAEEETVYCISGRGRLVSPEGSAELEPGVAVFIPSGLFHATECDGPEPLELLCSFSPPVAPGSYERPQEA